jgi:hypothetical protein
VWATLDSDLKVKILSAYTKKVEELIAKANTRLMPVPDETKERFIYLTRCADAENFSS